MTSCLRIGIVMAQIERSHGMGRIDHLDAQGCRRVPRMLIMIAPNQ
jgi:hypothetical protein